MIPRALTGYVAEVEEALAGAWGAEDEAFFANHAEVMGQASRIARTRDVCVQMCGGRSALMIPLRALILKHQLSLSNDNCHL